MTIDEVVLAINIVLGDARPDRCAHLDVNEDHNVTVDELILAAAQALQGCPAATTPAVAQGAVMSGMYVPS